jgi:ABC-2 type transport system permease protein
MSHLSLLIKLRIRMLRNSGNAINSGGRLKVGVVVFFCSLLVGMLFTAMRYGFIYLGQYPDFQEIMSRYLFSMYFLTMLLMLTFSNAVIAFGGLYRSRETHLLMSLPLRPCTIYTFKTLETVLFSSWAFLVLGLPLLTAYGLYGSAQPVHLSFYPAALALMLPFTLIPAAAGTTISMLLTRFFPRRTKKVIGLFVASLAIACLGIGGYLAWSSGVLKQQLTIDNAFMQNVFDKFSFSQNSWSPNYWISEGIMAARDLNWSLVNFYLAMLVSTAFFLWMLGDVIASYIYSASFSRCSSSPTRKLYKVGGWLDRLAGKFSRISPITSRLLVKDIRTFVRDPVQWSQVLIFFGLLFIYALNLRNLGYQRIVTDYMKNQGWLNFVAFANLAAAGLTLATLTTRFVFPLISMEGKRLWILALLPIKRSRLLLGKYAFSLGGSLIVVLPLVLVSAWMLETSAGLTWIHVITALGMCLGLPGIAVGLGALFPDYNSDTPAKVVSGFGGTLCLVISLGYVALLVTSIGALCWWHTRNSNNMILPLAATGATIVSLLVSIIPMWAGCKAINNAEL